MRAAGGAGEGWPDLGFLRPLGPNSLAASGWAKRVLRPLRRPAGSGGAHVALSTPLGSQRARTCGSLSWLCGPGSLRGEGTSVRAPVAGITAAEWGAPPPGGRRRRRRPSAR